MSKNANLNLKIFFFFLLVLFANKACAKEQWQFFRINAQYRGVIKKSFKNVGCAVAWFKDLAPGETQVVAHVCVQHPEKKEHVFSFRVNVVLEHNHDSIQLGNKIYSEFQKISEERQNDVHQLICLWDYIRRLEDSDNIVAQTLSVCGKKLGLKDIKIRGRQRQIYCLWPSKNRFSGKFFLEPAANSGWVLDKFRFQNNKLSISMVQDTAESISRDFRYKAPFSKIVFDEK